VPRTGDADQISILLISQYHSWDKSNIVRANSKFRVNSNDHYELQNTEKLAW
jgi:hypothetical protein